MPAAVDTLASADVPSLWGAALRLFLAVAALAAAAGGWLYWQRRVKSGSRHLEILDRAMLGRGVGVALLAVDGRRLLIGVSTEGVRLLRDLEGKPDRHFADVLAETREAGR